MSKDKAYFPLWLIALATGSAAMGITLITPALPVIGKEFQATADSVQLLLTLYLAMLALGQLIIGPLSDAFGRRVFFAAGGLIIMLFGGLSLLANDITTLTLCRVFQGLGAAACMSMGRAMINDYFERKDAQKAMASVQTIQAIVPMAALISGGFLVFYTGWLGVMSVIAVAGAFIFFCAVLLLPETHQNRTHSISFHHVMNAYKTVLQNRLFVCFMLVSSLQVGSFFALNAFIPYGYEAIGVNVAAFGMWFAMTPIGYISGNLFNRLFMVQRGIEKALFMGCVLSCLSMLILLYMVINGPQLAISLALPCMLFGFSNGFTVANATIGGISSAGKNAGTGSGLIGAMTMICGGVGGAAVIYFGAANDISIGVKGMLVMLSISFLCGSYIIRNPMKD